MAPDLHVRVAELIRLMASADNPEGPTKPFSWTETMATLTLSLATMAEADRSLTTRHDLRKVVENFGPEVLTLADYLRQKTSETGDSHLERMGGYDMTRPTQKH